MVASTTTDSLISWLTPDNRIVPGSANIASAKFPQTSLPDTLDPAQVAHDLVKTFSERLAKKEACGIASLFSDAGYWRDHLCLSWDWRTLQGRDKISEFLAKNGARLQGISLDESAAHRKAGVSNLDAFGKSQCVAFFVDVTTDVGSGQGVIKVIPRQQGEGGGWEIISLYFALHELKGFEEPRGVRRPDDAGVWRDANAKNWLEKRTSDANFEDSDPTVLVIGAGQCGLSVAARLKMLNLPTLVVDSNDRVGDSWRKRYRQLVLHPFHPIFFTSLPDLNDPIWFNHLPYMEFPSTWPVFIPKDKIAGFFEAYVSILELNVWTSTNLVSSTWDDAQSRWTVTLERRLGDRTERRTLHPRHIIQATGHSGQKHVPPIKGIDTFEGKVSHSSKFPGAKAGASGRRAVVVGACNSAHDIAQDMVENGYDVTMVQRSATCVFSVKAVCFGLSSLYSEAAQAQIPVGDADMMLWSAPAAMQKAQGAQLAQVMAEQYDREIQEGLKRAGFAVNSGVGGAGILQTYLQRGGGYYIDVGASQLIIDGKIKVKSGQEIEEVDARGVMFADGSRIDADEIVLATGYQSMRTRTRELFGDAVADRCEEVWGFDEEGEIRTMWRDSGHPGFWFMGGNLSLSRHFGRFLALRIKAIEEGLAGYATG